VIIIIQKLTLSYAVLRLSVTVENIETYRNQTIRSKQRYAQSVTRLSTVIILLASHGHKSHTSVSIAYKVTTICCQDCSGASCPRTQQLLLSFTGKSW